MQALTVGVGAILATAIALGGWLLLKGRAPQELGEMVTSPWGIAGMLLATQLLLLYFALRRRRRTRQKGRPVAVLFGGAAINAIPTGIFAAWG